MGQTAERIEALRRDRADLEERARSAPPAASLMDALRGPNVAVIAEVKRRSPSKGVIAADLSAAEQAAAYGAGGAAAISVLTEPLHFAGAPEDILAVRARVRVPVLKKDFHVDELQVLEARALGASALLLIARALEPARLHALVSAAMAWGVEPLVEIRDEPELITALDAGARVIGVNNRDLETLAIDPATSIALIPRIPADRIAIAESGVQARADVERVAEAGADAVLVGSSISAASDPAAAVRALAQVARRSRAG